MLSVTQIEEKELGEYQALFPYSNFMQSSFWAGVKREHGSIPYYFLISRNGEAKEVVLVLIKRIKGISIAYIPHGPSRELSTPEDLKSISRLLKKLLPKGSIVIRYDLLTGTKGDEFPKNLGGGLLKAVSTIQVPDTTILNIDRPEDEILASMHKKTRYNIKLAAKKGVEISKGDLEDIDQWYDMYLVTAKRDGISIHSRDYYKTVYRRAKDSEGVEIDLFFAKHEGDLLAGIFIITKGDLSTYLYGASSNIKRNLMPSYLLQFEGIKYAKALGSREYDFFGIPPVNDPKDPMYGLYRFKVRFGGEVIHRHGAYDYPLSILYYPFRLLDKLRYFYYKRLRR